MNVRGLRLFRLVVTTGSLSAAAESLSLSTSAASRLIALLEAELRLQLFHRTRRRLTLTAQGEVFYREAEHILAGFDEIPRIAGDIRSGAQSQLRLVTGPRIGQGLLAPALGLFRKAHPEIRVSVDMQSRFGIEGIVGTRVYDLGIISLPVAHPLVDIENRGLFRVRVEAVLPERHPLAAKASVTAKDLAAEPLLGLWPGQRWRKQIDDFFGSGGVRPRYAVETRSSLMACQLAREGAGVALLDRVCAQAIDLRGLAMRPLEPERWMLFGYVHQARQPLGANALAFLDCVRAVLERFREQSAENAASVVMVSADTGA
ncbi:MAG: LysR family transcriptional regulator [Burkholderiales bacterium]|jgi:DNA-binding transcriptional LysR family regulator|nr:LysR family transcriptional regulator [Burkholderiales bacterium]